MWQLAGNGWRDVLRSRLGGLQQERDRRLNTPKSDNIDQLFLDATGIKAVSTSWTVGSLTAKQAAALLDRYVTLRGAIAHRGSASTSVRKKDVVDYYDLVKKLVGKTGGRVNSTMKRATGSGLW
jgi:hypothetical protein